MSVSRYSSQSQASLNTNNEAQTLPALTTFLRDVPPQLTILLAELDPYISVVRRIAEAASWKSEISESWILLGSWWALCLLSEFTLRYFFLVLVAALYFYLAIRPPSKLRPPVSEQSLQATIVDLSVIEVLLPSLPRPHALPLNVIGRILAFLYIPSLIVGYFVRLRVLLGLFGTILFIWRARWAINLREAVWRSAMFRRGLSRVWALLSGQPSQTVVLSTSSFTELSESKHTLRFLITIYENQRWWVGLDWTTALLPSDRPSWCSAALELVPPPSAFSLPSPTVTYVGDGRGGLVKRTASWTWDEGEWKVSIRKELGLKRVEKEPPVPKDDVTQHANRAGKAKQKVYEASQKLKTPRDGDSKDVDEQEQDDPDSSEPISSLQDLDTDDQVTDNDGWIYGDNKWKTFSNSGGLGKYTRFRKWSRIALLTEVVEPASAAEAHHHAAEQREASSAVARDRADSVSRRSLDDSRHSIEEQQGEDDGDANGLRKRLKSVIRKAAASAQS
ncbi:hypothetical protein ACEPAI_7814 [Sanghuangporus weigelae]